ncbi:SMC-Scp complex subunit ScpB [Candidatus Pacebacteria bacterium]|nr:SMC-Scp complex subunit ScpB [Candidatus Paceibacterota bacterium]
MSEHNVEVPLDQLIEGVLFYKATPLKKSALCTLFACDEAALNAAIETLQARLRVGATRLIDINNELELVSRPELDPLIETLRKDDLRRDIGKAGAETLAILLYKGPLVRAEIDRIRGVNSSFILRNLAVRGLVEKDQSGKGVSYRITSQLLAHLGVTSASELPDFDSIMNALDAYEQEHLEQPA